MCSRRARISHRLSSGVAADNWRECGLEPTSDLTSEIMSEVPLHNGSRLGIGGEILLQCLDLPTHGADGFHGHRIHVGRNAVEDKSRAHNFTGAQLPESLPLFRDPHFASDNEGNGFRKLASLY